MPFSVLMTVEGVLTDDTFDFPGAPPLQEGILLFHALASVFTVHFTAATPNEEAVRRFLQVACGIKATQWGTLFVAEEATGAIDAHLKHLIHVQANKYDVRYFVTPDPWLAKQSIRRGITPLLCPHPSYSRPSFLPHAGQGRVDWRRIETEVMNGRLLRKEDDRLSQEEYGGTEAEDNEEMIP